jgi:hypothetical protein
MSDMRDYDAIENQERADLAAANAYPYLYAQGKQWVPLEDVRLAWQAWKDAWGTGDSEEAYALMEMDSLLRVDERGNVVG